MSQRRNRLRRKLSAAKQRRQVTNSTIRFPQRSTVDALLLAMAAKRSADMARNPSGATRILHLWGFACVDGDTAHDIGLTTIDLDDGPGSPILTAAGNLVQRVPGQVWGYGLAYSAHGEFYAAVDGGIPEAVLRAAEAGSLQDWPTADELCAATVLTATGRAYTAAVYLHMPELGPITWQENTVKSAASIREWVSRFDAGIPSAHAWAAALALDPAYNQAALKRLRAWSPRGDQHTTPN